MTIKHFCKTVPLTEVKWLEMYFHVDFKELKNKFCMYTAILDLDGL